LNAVSLGQANDLTGDARYFEGDFFMQTRCHQRAEYVLASAIGLERKLDVGAAAGSDVGESSPTTDIRKVSAADVS
jgi:hypothetical protein